ncbi:ParB/RepB/Spo0J family partition protein [Ectobacillus sp. JY-23]|uniref:ParB/RepB/Spo0J family partition protein n=1 Tax=Ectobacillus sp. JY-23 TaxID=2933872 RepID=UPI001FF2073E|nr:ParB/RepB/Spo0J family partition protein [Ectobacillus sp. JY-23]UOY94201.1 ParB/RepB/Spo0J family partition protein [Ectobacillus sp. JY-23]
MAGAAILGGLGGGKFKIAGKIGNLSRRFVNPFSLVGRQTKAEMSRKTVQKIAKDMKVNGYVGPPIKVYKINGKNVIIDGHHRASAAKYAGITKVPIKRITRRNLKKTWKTTPKKLREQVYEAGGF